MKLCYIWGVFSFIVVVSMQVKIPKSDSCKVRLLRQGGSQVVYTPQEFELTGDSVVMRRQGNRLIVEAAPVQSLLSFL